MNLNKIDANRIKFEAKTYPMEDPPKTGSKFGRFLQGFGALTAPIGFASAFFFPPAALIGATAYGLGQFGGYKDRAKQQAAMPAPTPAISFPGMGGMAGAPAAGGSAAVDPINVIVNRQAATNDMIGQVE